MTRYRATFFRKSTKTRYFLEKDFGSDEVAIGHYKRVLADKKKRIPFNNTLELLEIVRLQPIYVGEPVGT